MVCRSKLRVFISGEREKELCGRIALHWSTVNKNANSDIICLVDTYTSVGVLSFSA